MTAEDFKAVEGCTAVDVLTVKNQWDFWAFDTTADREARAFLHVEDITAYRALKKIFPNAQRLTSVDSMINGCRSWSCPQPAETALRQKEIPVISDVCDDVIRSCIRNGSRVLLLDTGKLPEEWMQPPICEELGERDTGRFFNSFRAGWDKGNLVTLINEDELLGDFPHEGYCDLHFYDMMQSARIMKPDMIEQEWGGEAIRIISSFSRVPSVARAESVVQDPNAMREQDTADKKSFQAREQGYYLKINDRLAICTLKLTDNSSGAALLRETVRCF